MTSQEIERAGFTTDPKKYHPDRAAIAWLKEIAFHLAVRNEREAELDQQLKSAGKVLDGIAERMPPRSTPDLPLDQAMLLITELLNQTPDIEDAWLRLQLRKLKVLLERVKKLDIETSPFRQDPQWAPDGPMKKG